MPFASRLLVAIKQQRALWNFVTKFEKKFYQRGFGNVARANGLALAGHTDEARRLLEGPLPDYERGAAHIAYCNLANGNESSWLESLNTYLGGFDMEPIVLCAGKTLIERFTTKPLENRPDGPLVSVIMPSWNAASTIRMAINSVLSQTWRNLELVVVDDASTDDTHAMAKQISLRDPRLKVLRLPVNSGPYVCKNYALLSGAVTGRFITGHDADDWAHPQRIAKHLDAAAKSNDLEGASVTFCLRMHGNGIFSRLTEPGGVSPDGAAKVARISCLFHREFLFNRLGSWDCVRFGADNEIMSRSEALLGHRLARHKQIGMICLDDASSLTRNAAHGSSGRRLSGTRQAYKVAYERWHAKIGDNGYVAFPPNGAPFTRPPSMDVDPAALAAVSKALSTI